MARKKDSEEPTVAQFVAKLTADPKKPFDKKQLDLFLQNAWPVVEQDFYNLPPDKRLYYFTRFMEYRMPKISAVQFEVNTGTNPTIEMLRQKYGGAYVQPEKNAKS